MLAASITKIGDSQAELSTSESGASVIKCPLKQFRSLDLCGSHVKDDVANLVDLDELSEVREEGRRSCLVVYIPFSIHL